MNVDDLATANINVGSNVLMHGMKLLHAVTVLSKQANNSKEFYLIQSAKWFALNNKGLSKNNISQPPDIR